MRTKYRASAASPFGADAVRVVRHFEGGDLSCFQADLVLRLSLQVSPETARQRLRPSISVAASAQPAIIMAHTMSTRLTGESGNS